MADNAWASWATVVRSWSMSSEFAKPYVDGFGEAAMQRPRIGSGTAAVCLAFIADGVVVGTDGLPASVPNLISWATLIRSPSPRPSPPGGAMASTSPPRSQILDTDRMGQWHADGRRDPGGSPRWNAVRWLLLAAVLAGLVGMHVLTDGDDTSVHGDLAPAPVAAAQSSAGDRVVPAGGRAGGGYAWSGAVVSAAPNDPMGADHAMAQCVLFLVTVGSALLLALLGSRCPATTRGLFAAVPAIWGELRRRGPPGPERPRIALCVTRT